MSPLRIKESCLYVADLDRTRSFYEGVLQLPVIVQVPGSHVFFRAGDSVLLCFLPESSANNTDLPGHYGEGRLHLAFEVEEGEYELWKHELVRQGIAIEKVQSWKQGKKGSFYFRDPDGHLLEILQKGIWESE